jgi:hypothetical protein
MVLSGKMPVDVAAVTDPHNQDEQGVVLDLVDDPIVAGAYSEEVFGAGGLLDACLRGLLARRSMRLAIRP